MEPKAHEKADIEKQLSKQKQAINSKVIIPTYFYLIIEYKKHFIVYLECNNSRDSFTE